VSGAVSLVACAAAIALVYVTFAFSASALARRHRCAGSGPGLLVGHTDRGRPRAVRLESDELQQGVLVGGSPGAGKTTLLRNLVLGLDGAIGAVIVDLKGDRGLASRMGIAPSQVFGLGDRGAASWNPLEDGDPASWRDVLMSTEEWSEPHYRRAASRCLGALLPALVQVRKTVELDEVIELLETPKRRIGLLQEVEGEAHHVLKRAVAAVESEASLRSGVLGLGNRLAVLRDSPATRRRFGASGGISLARAFEGERMLFSLPAAEFPDEAPAIAASVIQSLGATGQRLAQGDEKLRVLMVIDEAPRLAGAQLRQAVAIGRGAGIGSVLAVQDFADLEHVSKGTREAVETGANTWIVMRQVASAERIADALGTRKTIKETVQHDRWRLLMTDTGMRSTREVDEYRVSPNVIRGLERGEAIVWRRLRSRLDRVRVPASVTPTGKR